MKNIGIAAIVICLNLISISFALELKKGSAPIIFRVFSDSIYTTIDTMRFGVKAKDWFDEAKKEKQFSLDLPDYQTANLSIKICSENDTIRIHDSNWSDSLLFIFKTDTLRTRGKVRIPISKDYISKLKNDGGYSNEKVAAAIPFSYQFSSDSNLIRLRRYYNLDSVAGNGDEISKIINLMKWVHGIARHDGDRANPISKNSIDLIKVAQDSSRGLTCWMLGIILDEAYLSMGFYSRHIWCMPVKDTSDHDSHVVTIVYSTQLSKWIMMDPTSQVYFMDQKENILSLQEIRDYLKSGKEIKLNQDRIWNGKPVDTMGHVQYMTKNTYQFQCGLRSEFGYDSKPNNAKTYVFLIPNAEKGNHSKGMWIENGSYYTTNPDCFWIKPSHLKK